MKSVASRMVLRLDPTIKRTICKQCDTILIPGVTASVELDDESSIPVVSTRCGLCGREKNLICRADYVPFNEREGVVVVSAAAAAVAPQHDVVGTKQGSQANKQVDGGDAVGTEEDQAMDADP
ncbi:UNVERIFIED_CONTAM: Ribonuclease P protein subunit p21 [Siphonaria sp. JEL0065]|nr:Ribonuclease P protein subunit p21 [Siphonaria sp. JEL0065]